MNLKFQIYLRKKRGGGGGLCHLPVKRKGGSCPMIPKKGLVSGGLMSGVLMSVHHILKAGALDSVGRLMSNFATKTSSWGGSV